MESFSAISVYEHSLAKYWIISFSRLDKVVLNSLVKLVFFSFSYFKRNAVCRGSVFHFRKVKRTGATFSRKHDHLTQLEFLQLKVFCLLFNFRHRLPLTEWFLECDSNVLCSLRMQHKKHKAIYLLHSFVPGSTEDWGVNRVTSLIFSQILNCLFGSFLFFFAGNVETPSEEKKSVRNHWQSDILPISSRFYFLEKNALREEQIFPR